MCLSPAPRSALSRFPPSSGDLIIITQLFVFVKRFFKKFFEFFIFFSDFRLFARPLCENFYILSYSRAIVKRVFEKF